MKYFLYFCSVLVFACNGGNDMDLRIIKPLEKEIKLFNSAEIIVECGDFASEKERRGAEYASYLELELYKIMKDSYALIVYDSQKPPRVRILCEYNIGYGLPRIGRHFEIIYYFVTKINLKFIEANSNTIIGEIEYKRPLLYRNPKDYVEVIVEKLISSYYVKKG
jgi:hypothetical protein